MTAYVNKPYMKYHVDDLELLEYIWDQFQKSKESNLVGRNLAKIHDEWYIGWPGLNPWWDNNQEVAEKLKALTYPFNEPIMNCTIKFYTTGEYAALHKDNPLIIKGAKPYKSGWTNSVLLHQSSDLEGGDVVLAGDGWDKEIGSRLITMRHKNVGDTIVWNDEIVHGVSQIEKGYRAALIVIKERK